MTWLTPLIGGIVAAAVIPPLVLLYFLKLRRRTHPIASTLLWARSVEDLHANAPFQKLRKSLLLFLQLLVLVLVALALMQPQVQSSFEQGGKVVFLIDNSASMSATDVEEAETRLELAKQVARDEIERMYSGGLFAKPPGDTMIIAFSDRAVVASPFTSSKTRLLAAINRIELTHRETRIEEAFKLARAYTRNVDPDNELIAAQEPASYLLFSDGRIVDMASHVLRGEGLIFQKIGSAESDNLAITQMSVDRPYDKPSHVQAFVSLANTLNTPVTTDLELSINGNVSAGGIVSVTIPAATEDPETGRLVPGRRPVPFEPFMQPRNAIIGVRIVRPDDLLADNQANVVVPPAKQLEIAIVNSPWLLPNAVSGMGFRRVDVLTSEEFESHITNETSKAYDVVLLNDVAPSGLPSGRYLALGATPLIEGLIDYGQSEDLQRILTMKREHPVWRFVNDTEFVIANHRLVEPSPEINVIARGVGGQALMTEVSRGPVSLIHIVFNPEESTWPYSPGFIIFLQNAIEYLAQIGTAITQKGFVPGDVLKTHVPVGSTIESLVTPTETIPGDELSAIHQDGTFSWGPAELAGLYVLNYRPPGADESQQIAFAVNIKSEYEADLTASDVTIGNEKIEGRSAESAGYTALWPWAICAALALLMFEWWVYHRKTYL